MFKQTLPGIHSHLHKDGRITWTATVSRTGRRWMAKGFSTKQAAIVGRQRLLAAIDIDQLSWITPRLLSIQEAAAVLSHVPLWLLGPILMGLFVGLRASEIVMLRSDAIDYDRESLRVTDAHGALTREFPLPNQLINLFWLWQQAFPSSPFMFVDESGKPLTQAVLRNAFNEACTAAGLTDLRLPDLRFTFAAWALQANRPSGMIAVMMGARRSTAARFARLLHSIDRWTGRPYGRPTSDAFLELGQLIVRQPDTYAPFFVAMFASSSNNPGMAA